MTTNSCLHCFVTGRVQGVWFRESTRRKAHELKITGWVKNLEDGRVEVLGCGETQVLDEFLAWLHQGPPGAHVLQVEYRQKSWENHLEFVILR